MRQIVEPSMTGLAEIALPMGLGLVTAIAYNRRAVTTGTAHALRPAMLAHQIKALGIVQQRRELINSDTAMLTTSLPNGNIGWASDQMFPIAAIPAEITPQQTD